MIAASGVRIDETTVANGAKIVASGVTTAALTSASGAVTTAGAATTATGGADAPNSAIIAARATAIGMRRAMATIGSSRVITVIAGARADTCRQRIAATMSATPISMACALRRAVTA